MSEKATSAVWNLANLLSNLLYCVRTGGFSWHSLLNKNMIKGLAADIVYYFIFSTRKRMSVVVRTPEGKIKLYCKGAVSTIYNLALQYE